MKILKSLTFVMMAVGAVSTASAQNFYDDDIYFDPSKASKPAPTVTATTTSGARVGSPMYVTTTDGMTYYVDENGNAYPVNAAALPSSDTYVVDTYNTRDVDEYNRRYTSLADTISYDSPALLGDFNNTRLIERFQNPEIVLGSGDTEFISAYTQAQPSTSVVNIYVDTPSWYNPYTAWNYGYYRPYYYGWGWYDPWYSPSWSWSWGWGSPWYYPTWGWSWGWGPHYGHHHWGHHRPTTSPGAVRPHAPAGSRPGTPTGGYRGDGTRPSSGAASGGYRGGARPTSGSIGTVTSTRPVGGSRPSGAVGGSRPNGSVNVNPGNNGGTRPSSGNVGGSRPSSSSSGGYRSSGGGSRSSSGSHGGGGSRGGGGGGGRGGRR